MVPSPLPKLVVISGTDLGREAHLNEGDFSIGRGTNNDLVLADIAVSRRHTVIKVRRSRFILQDLSSGNGTIVNGALVKHHTLRNGDTIEIGNTVLQFVSPETKEEFSHRLVDFLQHQSPLVLLCIIGGIMTTVFLFSGITLSKRRTHLKPEPTNAHISDDPYLHQEAARAFDEGTAHWRARRWQEAENAYLLAFRLMPHLVEAHRFAERAKTYRVSISNETPTKQATPPPSTTASSMKPNPALPERKPPTSTHLSTPSSTASKRDAKTSTPSNGSMSNLPMETRRISTALTYYATRHFAKVEQALKGSWNTESLRRKAEALMRAAEASQNALSSSNVDSAQVEHALKRFEIALETDRAVGGTLQRILKAEATGLAERGVERALSNRQERLAAVLLSRARELRLSSTTLTQAAAQLEQKAKALFEEGMKLHVTQKQRAQQLWLEVLRLVPYTSATYQKAYKQLNSGSSSTITDEDEG